MSQVRRDQEERPHDVLSADEYGMPAPDPALHHERAHDVLSAEEYAMPAPDPGIHHGPVRLPDDPTGIAEAHDVLAAEEFAMPWVPPHEHDDDRLAGWGRLELLAGGGVLTLLLARRLLHKRHS